MHLFPLTPPPQKNLVHHCLKSPSSIEGNKMPSKDTYYVCTTEIKSAFPLSLSLSLRARACVSSWILLSHLIVSFVLKLTSSAYLIHICPHLSPVPSISTFFNTNLHWLRSLRLLMNGFSLLSSGCSTIGWVISSDTKGPWFESGHHPSAIKNEHALTINCWRENEARNGRLKSISYDKWYGCLSNGFESKKSVSFIFVPFRVFCGMTA